MKKDLLIQGLYGKDFVGLCSDNIFKLKIETLAGFEEVLQIVIHLFSLKKENI